MDIEFKNPSAVFYCGHLVEGHVQLELPEEMKFREIHLKFDGRVKTRLCRRENHDDKGEEEYFDHRITLGRDEPTKDHGSDVLSAGIHVFPFAFHLPADLPPSLEMCLSTIRYFVKATVHKKMAFDETVKRYFTVLPLGLHDFRFQQSAVIPVQVKGENVVKKFGFINKGIYTVTAGTDKKGYVPGEIVYVNLDINNTQSKATIKGCVAELIMSVTTSYDTTTFTENEKYLVSSYEIDNNVGAGESKTWCAKLPLPGITPSTMKSCDLIDVSHYVKIIFKNSHSLLGFKLPHLNIDIGTVPTPQIETMDEKQLLAAEMSVSSAEIPAPTSYEECIIQASINKDEVDCLPVYPYYKIRRSKKQ